jgi:hypothetical protein
MLAAMRRASSRVKMLIDDQGAEITPTAFCFDVGMKVADL